MNDSLLPSKIELLINQLEQEVRALSSSHDAEMNSLRESNVINLNNLKDQFEQRVSSLNEEYKLRIMDLESEIGYLRELNSSQRLMMEDSVTYIKGLEKKLTIDSCDPNLSQED